MTLNANNCALRGRLTGRRDFGLYIRAPCVSFFFFAAQHQ
jgi:hypothetical protein